MRNIIDNSLPNLSLIPSRELFLKYNYEYLPEKEVNSNINNINENYIINNIYPINNGEEINNNGSNIEEKK